MAIVKKDIQARLEKIPKEYIVAFAVRNALRVFPVIAHNGDVDFWITEEEDARKTHFLAVWKAIEAGYGFSIDETDRKTIDYAAAAAADAVRAAARAAARADAYSAYASAYASRASAYAAADASRAAAYTSRAAFAFADGGFKIELESAIKSDLNYLEALEKEATVVKVKQFYQQPLWLDSIPTEFSEVRERLKTVLKELNLIEDIYNPYIELISKGLSKPNRNSTVNPEGKQERSAPRKDAYGREAWAERLAALLRWQAIPKTEVHKNDSKAKPKTGQSTIGLFGHWGSGKSQFISYLTAALIDKGEKKEKSEKKTKWWKRRSKKEKKSPEFICTTFNAWEYHDAENYRAVMAHALLEGIEAEKNFVQRRIMFCLFYLKLIWKRHKLVVATFLFLSVLGSFLIYDDSSLIEKLPFLKGKGAWALLSALLISLAPIFSSSFAFIESPTLGRLFQFFSVVNYYQKIGEIAYLKQELNLLLKAGLRKNQYLLLFIDDLDRCHADKINMTFDTVRLLYDLDKVFVVIAIDERIAYAAVECRFDTERQYNPQIERDFLSKIIEFPISLPLPNKDGHQFNVHENLFTQIKVEEQEDKVETGENIEEESSEQDNPGETGTRPLSTPIEKREEKLNLQEEFEWLETERDYFETITFDLGVTNPRIVKRLYNAFAMLMLTENIITIKDEAERQNKSELIVFLLVYCESFPDLDFLSIKKAITDFVKERGANKSVKDSEIERLYNLVMCFVLPSPKRVE